MKVHKVADGRYVLFDSEMRLIEPANDFLKMQALKGRSKNTLLAYARDLAKYFDFLYAYGYKVEQFNMQTLNDYVEYLKTDAVDSLSLYAESRRTPQTINRMLSTVSSFYNYLGQFDPVDAKLMAGVLNGPGNGYRGMFYHTRRNPSVKHNVFRLREKPYKPQIFTDEQLKSLMNELPTRRDKIILKVLMLSGARIGEVLSLKIQDIPIPDSSRDVAVLKNIQSKGKHRDIYVPETLIEDIDEFIIDERALIASNHDYLFVAQHPCRNNNHITYSGIYSVFKIASRRVGIDFRFHDIRHTYITNLVESGMDFSTVKLLAGHSHISTTQKYVSLTDNFICDSLNEYWKKKEVDNE